MATRALQVVITGDTRQFSRSINSAGDDVQHLEGRVKGSAGRASQALKGLAVAGAGAAALGLKKSADAAIEAERSQAKLVTQLKASGISYREHAKEINRVIQATSRLSGIDDEDLQDSFTNIVRVTGDVNKSLRLTGLAADFARAKHIEVARAGEIVGKVAGGNTGILSRYGIVIDKNATASEALAALQKRFAGQAEAYGKTTAGALSRVNVASENVGETIGGHLTPIIAKAANGFVDFIAAARKVAGPASAFGKAWRKSAHDVGEAVSNAADKVKRFADRNRALMQNIIGYMSGLIRFVTGVFTGKWGKAWDGLRDAVKNAIQGIGRILLLAGAALGRLALRIGDKILDGIVKGLGNLGDAIYGQIKKGINKAADKAKNLINKVNPFGDIGDGIGKQIGDGVGIGAGGILPSGGAFGGSLMGARPAMAPFAAIGSRYGLSVTSGRRPGSITSSGNTSWHSSGEAIDMGDGRGPDANKMAFFKTMKSRFGGRLAELIYTPGGVGIKNGQPYRYGGQVAADHFDHVHVAFDSGRPGIGDGIGRDGLFDLAHRTWDVMAPMMGVHRKAPKLRLVSGLGQTGYATPGRNLVEFDSLLAKYAPRLALETIVHEFAHMGQDRGLGKREMEGGAEAFTHRRLAQIARSVGVSDALDTAAYPGFVRWVNGHKSKSWILRDQFRGFGSGIGTFKATSYGPPWGGIQGTGTTATGVNLHNAPHKYGVAVDPSVIPLGSMLKIHPNPFGYSGAFEAFDTGGAIKGNRIDFYDWRGRSAQMGWGTRSVSISSAGGGSHGGKSGGGGKKKGPYAGPRSGTVGPTTGGLGPRMTASSEQSGADVGLAEATARAGDNLSGLIAALSNELRLKQRRAKHIRRYLKRKRVSRANRQKFTEELSQLITDIAELKATLKEYRADAKGGATTVSGAEKLDAGVDSNAEAPATAADFANLAIAEAGLTPGTADDIAATQTLLGIRAGELNAARATGDPRKILEAFEAWKGVKDSLDALKEAVTLESDTRQRLIDLLAGVKDELKALNDNAKTLNAVGYREALKFMADSISGQVVGTNLQGRRQTAGNGRVAITP